MTDEHRPQPLPPESPPPSPHPRVFLSTVSREFKTQREEIARVVRHLGYEPVSMDNWSAAHGELRAWLREQLESCDGIIHLAGLAYGAEPDNHAPAEHQLPPDTPRYSYSQYEWHYAQVIKKTSWLILPGNACTRDTAPAQLDLPEDPAHPDPAAYQKERRQRQADHIARLKAQNVIRHEPADDKEIKLLLMTLRDHAAEVRQQFGKWQNFVTDYLARMEGKIDATAADVSRVLQGHENIAEQMRKVQEAISQFQQRFDPAQDPVTDWPRERLETELARALEMDPEDLRALLTAAKTSLDALVQGQALLATGQRDQAGEKFDLVIKQEQHTLDRLRQAYAGKGQIAYDQVKYEEALDWRQKAAALVDKAANPVAWAEAQERVAFILFYLARHREAEPLFREVLRLREQHLGPDAPDTATALNNLAQLLQATNRLTEAEPLMQRALAIDEASLGPEHPDIARDLNNLALLLLETDRMADAEPLIYRALAIAEASFSPEHPNFAINLNVLAHLLQNTNRLAEAESQMLRALGIDEANFGPEHPNVATDLNNLAQLLQATNRLVEAEPLMQRALAIDEASLGPVHLSVARDLSNLASLLHATNRLAEAEPLMRRALSIDEASFGPEHPNVAVGLNNLARLLQDSNRLAEAEPLMRRALAIDEASFGPEHPKIATRLNNLATLLKDTNRLAEAEPLMHRALVIDKASFGPEHPKLAIHLNNLAQLLQASNRLVEAEPLMQRALAIDEASFGPEHPQLAIHLNNLAQIFQATNRMTEAEPLMRRVVSNLEKAYSEGHPRVAIGLYNLAMLLNAMNRQEDAEPLMRRATQNFLLFTLRTGHPHPQLQTVFGNYLTLLKEMGLTDEAAGQRMKELMAEAGL